jgi:biopolymer transport protein ExbD
MAKRERRKSTLGNAEVDMTPMIDIVFQLIAFFMVITNFEQTQADERVKLPRDALAKPPKQKLEHEITLNIGFERDLKGNLKNVNAYLFNFGQIDKLPPLGCQKQLATEVRLYKAKNIKVGDVTIKIRSDAEVQTGVVQELIQLCQDAGFEKFAMSAISGGDD